MSIKKRSILKVEKILVGGIEVDGQECYRCAEKKPLGDFNKYKKSSTGHYYECRECVRVTKGYKKRSRTWTKQQVVDEIVKRADEGKSLADSVVSKEYGSLYGQGNTKFGSWRKAVEYCGIDYNKHCLLDRGKWDEEKIVRKIIEKHNNKEELSYTSLLAPS